MTNQPTFHCPRWPSCGCPEGGEAPDCPGMKRFHCPKWPSCGCPDGTVVPDCPGLTDPRNTAQPHSPAKAEPAPAGDPPAPAGEAIPRWALIAAAQIWCEPENAKTEMNADLCRSFARLLASGHGSLTGNFADMYTVASLHSIADQLSLLDVWLIDKKMPDWHRTLNQARQIIERVAKSVVVQP